MLYLHVVAVLGRVDEHAQHQEFGLRAFFEVHQVNLSVVVGGADLCFIFSQIANRQDRVLQNQSQSVTQTQPNTSAYVRFVPAGVSTVAMMPRFRMYSGQKIPTGWFRACLLDMISLEENMKQCSENDR